MYQGRVGTTRDAGNAYSWKCTYQGNWPDPVHMQGVDMNLACRQQYRAGAYARPLNPGDSSSWRCFIG